MKLNRMGAAGLLWVTQGSPYRESNSCMFVVWGIQAGGSKCWEIACLFLKSHGRNENRLHLQLAVNFFLFCKLILVNLGCRL